MASVAELYVAELGELSLQAGEPAVLTSELGLLSQVNPFLPTVPFM